LANLRRSHRYAFRLEVLLKGGWKPTPTTTDDVSFHGVFVRTDEERATNQLLKFTVTDPRSGEALELMGIVARCVPPSAASPERPPGIGISLFGNDRATEAKWVAMIRQVKAWADQGLKAPPPALPVRAGAPAVPASPPVATAASRPLQQTHTPLGLPRPVPSTPTPLPARPAPAAQPNAPSAPNAPNTEPVDATKRAHTRRPAKFNVTLRPDGVGALQQFELRDISEGGTFVLSTTLIPVGSRVNLRLVHPQTGETFSIQGEVARVVDSVNPLDKGIGIRFELSSEERVAWRTFVDRYAPPLPADLPRRVVAIRPPPTEPPIMHGPNETDVDPLSDPAAPPVSVTVPVAATAIGVRSVTIELLPVASIVKRSSVVAPPEWQYTKFCCVKVEKPRLISWRYFCVERYPPILRGNARCQRTH
jgi:Tfp pilus assembly protein PilZ